MKSRFLPVCLAVYLAASLLLTVSGFGQTPPAAPAAAQAQPKIVASKLQHDLGEVKKGQAAEYSFTFKNEGKADLQILSVAPS